MNPFPVTTSTLSEQALGEFIIDTYRLPKDSICTLFRTGINHTYFLKNASTRYAIRVYCHNWRTPTEINEELKLLMLLKIHDLSVSYPVSDKTGSMVQEINAPEGIRYVVLFSFAEGGKIRFMNQDTCFAIGALMAKIHTVTANKQMDRTAYNSDVLVEQSYQYLKRYFQEDLDAMKLFKAIGDQIAQKFQETPLLDNQKGIVHLDIWYDNLSVSNDKDITIFDFDNCGNGAFILDVAYFCNQLFFIEVDKNDYELKKASFLKGYESERKLSEKERSLIPEAGASIFLYYLGVQAQRFDWSNIFLSENYLSMFVNRTKSWLDYYEAKHNI